MNLKERAFKCLERNTQRNKGGTKVFHRGGKKEASCSTATDCQEQCQGCSHFEALEIAGELVNGCVRTLPFGEWRQEWQRIPNTVFQCWRYTKTIN